VCVVSDSRWDEIGPETVLVLPRDVIGGGKDKSGKVRMLTGEGFVGKAGKRISFAIGLPARFRVFFWQDIW